MVVIVERSIYAPFVEAMAAAALIVGDPLDAATQMGPLISTRQRERAEQYLALGRAEGARLVCGGQRLERDGYFVRPAVFAEARPRMRIVDEEIFGPVAVVLPFDSEAEAIALANDTIYGLSGSLWTKDLKRGLRVAQAVRTGVLSVNSSSSVHLQAPFGGYTQSGLGRELGMHALEHYTDESQRGTRASSFPRQRESRLLAAFWTPPSRGDEDPGPDRCASGVERRSSGAPSWPRTSHPAPLVRIPSS